MKQEIVKKDFDFGWRQYMPDDLIKLTFLNQKGDILDIGCGTCQLYRYLKKCGWNGTYYGIDIKKYENYDYPKTIKLMIGDALKIDFPKVDTVILYNILEHVDDPIKLLKKALQSTRKNVLINVPKRNEELWKFGIVEYHQLDKTHKHCGFTKEEIYNLVDLCGGKITKYIERGKISANIGINLWNSIIPKILIYGLSKIFRSKVYYQEIWCEIVKNIR